VTRIALAAIALSAVGRIVQLACAPADKSPVANVTSRKTGADAELAALYQSCPMAAVIDLKSVAASPEKVDALLPPYRLTADREPAPPMEPAVPRIRYPLRLRPSASSLANDTVLVAQNPTTAAPTDKSGENKKPGEWLVDPKEWYGSDENSSAKTTGTAGVESAPALKPSAQSHDTPTPGSATSKPEDTHNAAPVQIHPAADESLPAPGKEEPLFAAPPGAGAANPPDTQHPASSIEHPNIDPHLELFTKNNYPSARECATCHEDIYRDWAISAHAYAAVSPMFHKFEQTLNNISQGTLGYFCMRCHAPVATALCASRAEPLWNLPEAAREGITCIACHRVQYVYGKSNGERRIEPGNIFAPVLGGIGGDGVAETIHRKSEFKVKTSPDEPGPGQNIHAQGIYFEPLTRSEFCMPCHQVAVYPGIKLEVVWEQYRASPACKKGIQCQDCHMGRVPGLPAGYDCGPVAKIAGKTINDNRKKSNHVFYGPNYPIAHPGVFPFNLKANRWTMDQWLTFDWRAGWGTEKFEEAAANGQVQACFPPVWAEADDRRDAREIIDANIKQVERKRDIRTQIMTNGSHVDGPYFDSTPCRGQDVRFHYIVTNTNEGHNLLTASLGAQPQLWANVVLIGPDGNRLWESGYLDTLGDLANIHSVDVREKRLPYDWQLFNLQTMFLITGAVGTDREFFVPVNVDFDQLPFIRPGTQPIPNINHPPFIRMESQSLAPLGSRRVPYRIPAELVRQPGTYRLSFRMRSRAEPMYLMRFCGATEEMQQAMNEQMIDLHPVTVEFVVH
jgi:hypothetical protein